MAKIKPTTLRQQLFKIIDRVIKTGTPAVIERNGHTLKLVLEEKKSKLSNLTPHKAIIGDPDELVSIKAGTWAEENPT